MPENLTLRDVKIYVKFETAATKQALVSNDTLPVLMGKINKWYNLLDEIAWTGHPTYIVTPTTSSVTPAEGDTFTAIDSLTVTNGHVTGYNTKTVTMPKSNIQDINYDSTTNELTITYSNESEETVPVGGSTYVAGDGIIISDGASSFELNENTVTNTEYFFDTRVTSNISGRIFTKYTTEPALGAVVYYGYTQPFFVGLTADSVKYGTNYDSHIWPNPDHPPFEYKGVKWYYSGNAYGMSGNGTDSSGHMQKLPGNYSVATEEDLQNIARAIIDAADIIMSPSKSISAKIGEGLSFDSNDAIQNEGLLSVTQDFDDKNRLTFGTTYGDIIIDIPTGGGGDSSETYVAGDAVSLHNSTAPLTAPLTHFKWEISQTRAKAEGTVYVTLQVDEIEFYDENDQLITFSAIAGSFKSNSSNPPSPSYATTPTVQTPDKIIDNDITTKCCVTNFTSELDAMVFIFELDSTNPITAQDIKCYRYYTADNDTSADPVTWTLSVSPDGIEWFVVDTQTEFNAPTARETSTDYFTMTKPTIPAKSINVKYDDGLMLDAHGDLVVQTGKGIEISDNAVTAKLGVGLTFDNIDAITLDETIDLALNCDYSQ